MRRPNVWLYSLGMLGIMNLMHATMMYLTFYYVDTLGLAAALFAVVRTAKMVWDGVNDPLAGVLSDRTRTRWGRRRPWMLFALPFYALAFVALFWVPPAFRTGTSLFVYVLVVLLVYETFETMVWTNYNALFPELFTDLRERARASAIKNAFHVVAMVIGFALPGVLVDFMGVGGMAALFAVLLVSTILLTLVGSPEQPNEGETRPVSLAGAFRETFRDRAFWVYTTVAILSSFAESVIMGGMAFYAKYALGLEGMGTAVVMGSGYLAILPTVGIWSRLIQRWGAIRGWMYTTGLMGLVMLSLLVVRGLAGGLVAGVLIGSVMSGFLMSRDVMMAYLIDRDARRSGQRREGLYYGILKLITRLADALNAFALVAVGALFGYRSANEPGPNPEFAFRFMLSVLPFAALILAALIIRFYPKEAEGAAAAVAEPVADPATGTVVLEITGMHCDQCVARIQKELRRVPGVVSASVDLYTRQGIVEVAGARVAHLLAAVSRAGYLARQV